MRASNWNRALEQTRNETHHLLFLAALALAACDRLPFGKGDPAQAAHTAKQEGDHGHDHGPAAQSITHFTDRTELFVQFPALVVGAESLFAAHLTWLFDPSANFATGPVSASGEAFKPVTEVASLYCSQAEASPRNGSKWMPPLHPASSVQTVAARPAAAIACITCFGARW